MMINDLLLQYIIAIVYTLDNGMTTIWNMGHVDTYYIGHVKAEPNKLSNSVLPT